MSDNVFAFVPRPKAPEAPPPPKLQICQLQMDIGDCSLHMSVCDASGQVFVIPFRVAFLPDGVDIDDVLEAWEEQLHGARVVKG